MSIEPIGADEQDLWDKFTEKCEPISEFVRKSAPKIEFIALSTLNLLMIALEPWFFLLGFITNSVIQTIDSFFDHRFTIWVNSFLPEDPVKKITLISIFSLITFSFSPALFSFGLGGFSGKRIIDLTYPYFKKLQNRV